ncbi:P2Y purinoceptor 6-like [Gadus morhua]|uniref:P2Y purinoceptor 6-like n=1 Tax=Gadus morhua TaxID=8049 RepID=UPI0011B4EC93|nr:P2Y purinoceptor 6-like [Gadus morhua]
MDDFHLCPLSEYYKRFLLPVSYSVTFVAGLGLNVVLLWDVCSRQPQQHRNGSGTVVYVANLAVADLLYVLTLPILIVSYAMGNVWYFGDIVCKIVRFLFIVNLHCSMTLLACVSVYRFLGVRFPVSGLRLRTKRAAVWTSGSVWVVVTAEVLPTLAYSHTGLIDNQTVCFEMTDPRQFNLYFPYGIFLCVVGFFLPFLLTVCCYCSMIRTLCRPSRASSPLGAANTRNKSLRTLVLVCVFFVLCFVPYHVVRTVYLFVRVYMVDDCHELNVVVIALKIWQPLISLNCCANPLLYFLGSGRYRKKLRTWLCPRNTRVLPAAVCVVVVDAGPKLSCPA